MKVLVLLFEILLLQSCIHRPTTELVTIKPIDDLQEVIYLSDFADSISLIQLDDSLILSSFGSPNLTDSFFVVSFSQGVLKYSYQGKLLKKIGGIGQGPMEYNAKKLMSVDTCNKRICVYSIPDKTLISYSYDGELLNRIRLNMPDDTYEYPVKMSVLFNKYYFFYASMSGLVDPYYWVVSDTGGNIIDVKQKHGCPILKKSYACSNFCFSTHKCLLYYNLFNDTIFRFRENKVEPAFLWAEGKHRISLSTEELTEEMKVFTMFAETKRFLVFKWIDATFKSNSSFGIYDKKKKRFMGTKKLIDDLNMHVSIPLKWEFTFTQKGNNDYMIGKIEPFDLPEEVLQREGIDPEGNMVVLLIQLKDE